MGIRHWELAGAEDERLFSPNCWRERMLDLFGGMPRATRGYPVWA